VVIGQRIVKYKQRLARHGPEGSLAGKHLHERALNHTIFASAYERVAELARFHDMPCIGKVRFVVKTAVVPSTAMMISHSADMDLIR
jgi:hypothetical protein